jgi:hypothetical protein
MLRALDAELDSLLRSDARSDATSPPRRRDHPVDVTVDETDTEAWARDVELSFSPSKLEAVAQQEEAEADRLEEQVRAEQERVLKLIRARRAATEQCERAVQNLTRLRALRSNVALQLEQLSREVVDMKSERVVFDLVREPA